MYLSSPQPVSFEVLDRHGWTPHAVAHGNSNHSSVQFQLAFFIPLGDKRLLDEAKNHYEFSVHLWGTAVGVWKRMKLDQLRATIAMIKAEHEATQGANRPFYL